MGLIAQYNDSMHVVGHDDECIELNPGIMLGQIGPGLVYNRADFIQAYIGFDDITE